jgi:cold shock CspA family protein
MTDNQEANQDLPQAGKAAGSEDPVDDRVYSGVVAWFGGKQNSMGKNKSYGFIEWSDGGAQQPDMFVHFSNIITNANEFKTLKKGQKVSFQVGANFHGEPKAVNVNVLPD